MPSVNWLFFFGFCLHPYWIHPCFKNSSMKHVGFHEFSDLRMLVSKTSKRESHQTKNKNRGNFSICSHPSQKMSESPVRALREFSVGGIWGDWMPISETTFCYSHDLGISHTFASTNDPRFGRFLKIEKNRCFFCAQKSLSLISMAVILHK